MSQLKVFNIRACNTKFKKPNASGENPECAGSINDISKINHG
jgi:DNA polymerase II large subunit